MVWHILKKDWKLLRWMVVAVALINTAYRVLPSFVGGYENGYNRLADMVGLFQAVSFLGTAILIALAVHQDSIPGLRQDWLIRPIARRDLVLSKLLFVVLLVRLPVFAAGIAAGLTAGLPLGPSVAASVSLNLLMLLAFDLPVLAFAAFTRNLIEIFGTAAVMLLGYALLMVSTPAAPQTQGTGIEWIADAASTLWGVAAVAVILTLQYRGRKTVPSRWTFGIASVVWVLLQFIPWQAAFAIQEKLSRESADAGPVRIAFAADRERSHRGPLNPAGIRFRRSIQEHVAFLYIPIRVDGLDGGRMLVADRAEVHVSDLSGKATDLAPIGQSGNFLASPDYQEISVLSGIYKNLKDQPLRMDIDYSLTLMQLNRQGVLPAAGADLWIPDLGRCSTGVNALRTEVAVHCVAPARPPCVTWSLESRNKAIYTGGDPCRTDYAPYADPSGNEFSNRFTIGFPFLDAAEEARLEGGRFLARVYRPVAHFTRRVSIPRIRLEDWAEEPGRGPGYYSPRYGAPE